MQRCLVFHEETRDMRMHEQRRRHVSAASASEERVWGGWCVGESGVDEVSKRVGWVRVR